MMYECYVLKQLGGKVIDKVAIKGNGKMEAAENWFQTKHGVYGLRYVRYVKTVDMPEYEQMRLCDS